MIEGTYDIDLVTVLFHIPYVRYTTLYSDIECMAKLMLCYDLTHAALLKLSNSFWLTKVLSSSF